MSKASEILGRGGIAANKSAEPPRPAVQLKSGAPAEGRPAATQTKSTQGSRPVRPAQKAAQTKKPAPKQARRSGTGIVRLILNHLAIILSLMYIVLYVIDRINNAMEFINNDLTKALLLILSLIAIINAETAIFGKRK